MKLALDKILEMVQLVKGRSSEKGRRGGKFSTSWLKEAARSLETYQLVGRDWICQNVWELPPLPTPKPQDYDPEKGRRDIRYYPESKVPDPEALLETSLEEQLDFLDLEDVDEETLLAESTKPAEPMETVVSAVTTSPEASSSVQPQPIASTSGLEQHPMDTASAVSPRRSPRIAARSPRRSPRIANKKGQGQKKRSPSPKRRSRWDSRKRLPSPKRTSRRDSRRTYSPKKGSSRSSYRAPTKDTIQGVSMLDLKRKSVHFADDRPEAYSPDVQREVRVTETRPAGATKRRASSSLETLVISTTTLKKAKTPDLLLQVRKQSEERRERECSRRARRDQQCWVPGCVGPAKYLKAHAFFEHIPSVFDERLPPSDERVLRGRRNALNQATRWLLGRPASLDELVAFLVVQKLFSVADNTEFTSRQIASMTELCNFLHEPVPQRFELSPCNSVGVLVHWKALLLIAASLEKEERQYWLNTFQSPDSIEVMDVEEDAAEIAPQRVYPEAFDAHFHLDRTLRDLGLPACGSLEDILRAVPVDEEKRVTVAGAVAIYCDPKTYPSERGLVDLPDYISVGIGFHPKHAKNSIQRVNDEAQQLRRLLRHPRVVAFGEIGLDHSEPMKYWAYQVELLEKVLPALEDRHVLVIHCRGMDGDCGTEAFLLLLYFLRRYVRSHQPIHLHCFSGNQYVLERWLEVFPRTFFGFTNKVRSFNAEQVAALNAIGEDRLLLESDAPYFAPRGSRVSSPGQLYLTAEALANHRNLSVARVLEITLANGRHLYQSQQ